MRHVGTSLVMLAAALATGSASAITLTGLTPSTLKVKVGQPVQLTLTATEVPAAGPAWCFFLLTPGRRFRLCRARSHEDRVQCR